MTETAKSHVEGSAPVCPNSVLGKAFSLFSAFDRDAQVVPLAELSCRTGIPKPSVYRLCQQLVSLGLLERHQSGYRLGTALFILGQRASAASHLHAAARPVVVDLCAATGAPVHVSVLKQGRVRYVERLAGSRTVHALIPENATYPATATASGRLLLAHTVTNLDTPADHEALLGLDDRVLSSLWEELSAIRQKRFAAEQNSVVKGFKAFSVPITGLDGTCIAALSATVPLAHRADQALVTHLWAAASRISREYRRLVMGADSDDGPQPPRIDGQQQCGHRPQLDQRLLGLVTDSGKPPFKPGTVDAGLAADSALRSGR